MFEVLVVDDSPVTRKVVRRALELSGVALGGVREAADGAEALALLADRPADLVLADVHMPVMSGAELVDRMSRDPALARIPVVVIATALPEPTLQALFDRGVRGYLAKPFRPEALCDLVRRFASERRPS